MATHKSAEKRARSSETKRLQNRQYIAAVRTSVKKFRTALTEGQDGEAIQNLFRAAQSMLAKAASKGLLHRNNAARRISRLADAIKAQATPAAKTAAPKRKASAAPKAAKAASSTKRASAAPKAKKKPSAAKKK